MENSALENRLQSQIAERVHYMFSIPQAIDGRDMRRELNLTIVLDALSEPMTNRELQEKTGLKEWTVKSCTAELIKQGEIDRFKLYGNRGNGEYNCLYLFGELTDKIYYYKDEQRAAVAELIVGHLPMEDAVQSIGIRRAVENRLRHCLQPDLYNLVKFYCSMEYQSFREEKQLSESGP